MLTLSPGERAGVRASVNSNSTENVEEPFLTWEVEPRARIFFGPGSGCRPEQNPKWGEHPIADAPLPALFSWHETQKLLPGPKPKTGRCITANCGGGLKPKRN